MPVAHHTAQKKETMAPYIPILLEKDLWKRGENNRATVASVKIIIAKKQ